MGKCFPALPWRRTVPGRHKRRVIDFNLIPFGWSVEKKALVDIGEVARGTACNCICPSCQTRLIARHGEVREWHFAHASRRAFQTTQTRCTYSLFVSARMMARQLIGERLELELPALTDAVRHNEGSYEDFERFTVTQGGRFILEEVGVEKDFDRTPVDVRGRLLSHTFIVYMTHPGRPVPEALQSPVDKRSGILELQLHSIGDAFSQGRKAGHSYREVLSSILTEDVTAKRWIFHPRYERAKAMAQKVLLARQASRNDRPTMQSVAVPVRLAESSAVKKRRAEYKCAICNFRWEAWHPAGIVDCPSCNGRLCGAFHRDL